MALAALGLLDTYAVPRQTQTADTPIVAPVPPRVGKRTKISYLEYISGGTAHALTFIGELGRTTVVAAVAGAGTVIRIAKDPGVYSTNAEFFGRGITPSASDNAIAASDYFGVVLNDGTFYAATVSSVATNSDGTVSVTVSAIPAAGIRAGATFWFMGVAGDTDPHYNRAHAAIAPPTSATTGFPGASGAGGAVVWQSYHPNSPVILYSNNITAAGTLSQATALYQ